MHARRLKSMAGLSLLIAGLTGPARLEAQTFQLTAVRRLTNSEMAVAFTAPVGRTYRLETANNVSEWAGLFTFPTNTTPSLSYTDSAAPFLATRYYRGVQLTGSNLISGDHLATSNGEVILQPRNHATFVLQWNGKMVYLDPTTAATYAGLPKADLILVTHAHGDHFSTAAIDAVRGSGCALIVPQLVFNSLTTAQKSLATVLTNNATATVLGMTIQAVPAYNANHPLGEGNGYILEAAGKRIYVTGDTDDKPELRTLPNIDVAFVCMNQPYTMTVSAATNFVRTLRPKIVYPYHYRDSSGATTSAATFKQWLGRDLGIEVRLRSWY